MLHKWLRGYRTGVRLRSAKSRHIVGQLSRNKAAVQIVVWLSELRDSKCQRDQCESDVGDPGFAAFVASSIFDVIEFGDAYLAARSPGQPSVSSHLRQGRQNRLVCP